MNPAWKHLTQLVNLGSRPIGSPANQAAADYIRDTLASFDLEVEEQPYPCTAWKLNAVKLERKGKKLEVEANPFSRSCDVTGAVLPVGSLKLLESVDTSGRILLLYGDLVRAPISPKSWFLKDERDDRFIRLLESGQPAALLSPPTATDYFGMLTHDAELTVSAATIPADVALQIFRDPDTPVHLMIDAENSPTAARNIVARTKNINGMRIVLCAHFDTAINTPGAADNGGGVACLLALAERFKRKSLPFGLEFVAFNGEEYLPMGDDEYLRRAEGYFSDIQLAINIDGAGLALGTTSITMLSASDDLQQRVQKIVERFPGVVWVDPWPESNHSTFAMRKIPAVAVTSEGERRVAHFPHDDLEGMSTKRLEEVINLVEQITTTISV